MGLFALICRYLIAIRWGSCVHRRFTRTFALRYVTLEIVTLRERSTTMVDKTAAGSQQTDQRDADTRDSLAALARRRSNSSPIVLQSDVQAAPQEKQEKQEKQSEAGSALQTGEDANDDAGAFPAVQSASQTEQAQRRRPIRSLAAGSLRRTNIGNAEKAGDVGSAGSTGRTAGNGDTPSPRIASSAPHYAN